MEPTPNALKQRAYRKRLRLLAGGVEHVVVDKSLRPGKLVHAPSIVGFIDLTAPDRCFVRINPVLIREMHRLPHGWTAVNYAGNIVRVVETVDQIETLIARSMSRESEEATAS